MAESATVRSSDPDGYAAGFGDACINLTIVGAGDFKARLTRLKLKDLEVYQCCESLPRIAYILLPPEQLFLSFSAGKAPPIFNGFALRSGDMVLHSRGERMHQRFGGECQWGLISLSSEQLASCSKALTGRPIASPPASRILRPSRAEALRFQRLVEQACHLAEARKKLIERPEVARALEQEMLHAIIHSLATTEADDDPKARHRHADVMVRFGEHMRKVRTRVGVSQEKLADLAGLHRTYVSSVERGQRNISIVNIQKLADALAVSLRDLMPPGRA